MRELALYKHFIIISILKNPSSASQHAHINKGNNDPG